MAEIANKAIIREKPEKPGLGACCGSSCDPCVLTLYAQEVKVWKEYWEALNVGDQYEAVPGPSNSDNYQQEESKATADSNICAKMPGSWMDW